MLGPAAAGLSRCAHSGTVTMAAEIMGRDYPDAGQPRKEGPRAGMPPQRSTGHPDRGGAAGTISRSPGQAPPRVPGAGRATIYLPYTRHRPAVYLARYKNALTSENGPTRKSGAPSRQLQR